LFIAKNKGHPLRPEKDSKTVTHVISEGSLVAPDQDSGIDLDCVVIPVQHER
jgi:hypothetical protein